MQVDTEYIFHNKRALLMWEQIIKHVDFRGKSVIDLGCGYADFSFLAYLHGANWVDAVDFNNHIVGRAYESKMKYFTEASIFFHVNDIESRKFALSSHYDVGICFSVLPYLREPFIFLRKFTKLCTKVLLEVQYAGDGPGFPWVKNDSDFAFHLGQSGFMKYEPIGLTKVKQDRWKRTIWLCT